MGQLRTLFRLTNKRALLLPLAIAVVVAVLFHYAKNEPPKKRTEVPNANIPIEDSELDGDKVSYYENQQKDSVLSTLPETELYSKSLEKEGLTEKEALVHEQLRQYYQETRLPKQNPYLQRGPSQKETNFEEEESDPIQFYSRPVSNIENEKNASESVPIKAQVVGEQEISEKNPRVKLRLMEPLDLGEGQLPKNSIVVGTAHFDPQRIYIEVGSLRLGNAILPVSLEAYDHYGIRGLAVVGGTGASIQEEMTEAMSEEVLDDPNLRQVPGIRATKKLFRKMPKAKLNNDFLLLMRKK